MIKRVAFLGLSITLIGISLILLLPNYTVWTVVVNAILGLVLGLFLIVFWIQSFSFTQSSGKELEKIDRIILFLAVVFTANLLLLFFSLHETLAEGKSMMGTTLLSIALFIAAIGQVLAKKKLIKRR